MARRMFFVPEVRRGTAELTGDDAEHLVRVLRAEAGQIYEISDNSRMYLAEITVARKSGVTFQVIEELAAPAEQVHMTLVAALIKFDRFEWMMEKATELGVAEIQPFEAARTDKGLFAASVKRRTRWERIALESSQQTRRVHLPVVVEAVRFAKALEMNADVRLLLDENAGAPPILQALPEERKDSDRVALLLGPEGGWTEEEHAQATGAGWRSCSLGNSILRAETAAIAGLAVVRAAWGKTIP